MFENSFEGYTMYLRPKSTDMRKGGSSLAILIESEMQLDPFSKSLFFFCSKNRKILKVLVWDRQGFWEMTKRLESGTYRWWPESREQAMEVKRSAVLAMFRGEDPWRRLPELRPKRVS